MKNSFLINLIVFAFNTQSQTPPPFQWVKNTHDVQGNIILDPSGNLIIAGTFTGTPDFDPGPGTFTLTTLNQEAFVAKYDATGNFLWAKMLNGGYDLMNSFKTDVSGNIYSTGAIATGSFDSFIWKLDPAGNTVWLKYQGGSYSDNGIGIDVDIYGNVYTTGSFSSSDTDFDPGPGTYTIAGTWDGYVTKLDPNGNFIWAKQLDNNTNQPYACVPWDLIVDNANGVYVCGQYEGTTDFDPGLSTYTFTSAGTGHDGFIQKLDTAGNFLWAGTFPSLKDGRAQRLVKSSNGVYVAGYCDSIADLDPGPSTNTINTANGNNYIVNVNANGTLLWAKQTTFATTGLTRNNSCDLFVMGGFSTITDFDPGPGTYTLIPTSTYSDGFIGKMDSTGTFKWAVQLQDTGYGGFTSAAINNAGDIYATGWFNGTVDFNSSASTYTMTSSTSSYESFLLKLTGTTVGISKNEVSPYFNIYPNPASGTIYVEQERESNEIKTIEILSSFGQKVYESKEVDKVNVSQINPGSYLLRIIGENSTEVRKIVIQ